MSPSSTRSLCPTCSDPIDPAHAPVARIVGAKIVTFCSQACAKGKAKTRASEPTAPKPASSVQPTRGAKSADVSKPLSVPTSSNVPTVVTATSPMHRPHSVEVTGSDNALVEPAEPGTSLASNRRRWIVLVCVVLACGGLGLIAFDAFGRSIKSQTDTRTNTRMEPSHSSSVDPNALSSGRASGKALAATQASVVTQPDVLFRAANQVLSDLRKSQSRRILRLATMALARGGSDEAIAGLRELLQDEDSELNRVALAYGLARVGEADGLEILVGGLSSKNRRDVRVDAAIGLLNLGDQRGAKTLHDMLNFRHYKIAAAGHLARSGDSSALRELQKIYAGGRTDDESKLRAAVALGRAGEASVAEFLGKTLTDGRFQVGAADALATLGDKSAIPALAKQLELNAMRVQAALALRRLGADVSLEPLAVALTEDDEVTRVTAAEAILIMTGPKEIAARD